MATYSPEYCVWEATLACSLLCRHCGSSAGAAREGELTTQEAIGLLDQLADLGTREITFSGGEFILRPDWPLLLLRARELEMTSLVVSNGFSISRAVADRFAASGVSSVSISLDGGEVVHNRLRPVNPRLASTLEPAAPGAEANSFRQILAAFRNILEAGVTPAAITQVSRANLGELEVIRETLLEQGVRHWQVQLTNPMGRLAARSRDSAIETISPADLPRVYDFIRDTQRAGVIRCQAADNIGYYGKDEHLLRSGHGRADCFWTGCDAGLSVIGITSSGGVLGCLSMPHAFIEGNIRESPLRAIWERPGAFAYNREFDPDSLTGHCRSCDFRRLCRAGCRSFAFSALGRISENTHCIRHVAGTP